MASAMFRTSNTVYDIILNIADSPYGATDDAISRIAHVKYDSVRRRRLELVEAGLIVATGQYRNTRHGRAATVWRVA